MTLLTFDLPPLELARAKRPSDIRAQDLIDVEALSRDWLDATSAANRKVMRAGYADMAGLLKEDARLNVEEPRVASFLEGQVGNRIATIAESRLGEVADVIARVTDAGGTTADLSAALREHFDSNDRFWATRIARTETAALYNQAGVWGMKDSGIAMKEWLSSRDSTVRESHVTADGQRVPIDGDFMLDGGSGPAPGLINAAEESINCRCTVIPVVEGDDQFLERATAWRAFDDRLSAAELLLGRTWLGLFEDMGRDAMRKYEEMT